MPSSLGPPTIPDRNSFVMTDGESRSPAAAPLAGLPMSIDSAKGPEGLSSNQLSAQEALKPPSLASEGRGTQWTFGNPRGATVDTEAHFKDIHPLPSPAC